MSEILFNLALNKIYNINPEIYGNVLRGDLTLDYLTSEGRSGAP